MAKGFSGSWEYLPAPALCNIFKYLSYKDLINAGRTCVMWYNASKDDFLWKDLLCENFKIDRSISLMGGRCICLILECVFKFKFFL